MSTPTLTLPQLRAKPRGRLRCAFSPISRLIGYRVLWALPAEGVQKLTTSHHRHCSVRPGDSQRSARPLVPCVCPNPRPFQAAPHAPTGSGGDGRSHRGQSEGCALRFCSAQPTQPSATALHVALGKSPLKTEARGDLSSTKWSIGCSFPRR